MNRYTEDTSLQPNKDFPADCEMLDYLQNQHARRVDYRQHRREQGRAARDAPRWITALAGPKVTYSLHTREHPEGEVLFWEGGAVGSGMYLKQEVISVQAQGLRLSAGIREAVARTGRRRGKLPLGRFPRGAVAACSRCGTGRSAKDACRHEAIAAGDGRNVGRARGSRRVSALRGTATPADGLPGTVRRYRFGFQQWLRL